MRAYYYISNAQIRDMKLAIGWNTENITGTKYRRIITDRNAYFTKDDHEYWNKLCAQGLAEKTPRTDVDGYIYKLSVEGIALLEEITDVKIDFRRVN